SGSVTAARYRRLADARANGTSWALAGPVALTTGHRRIGPFGGLDLPGSADTGRVTLPHANPVPAERLPTSRGRRGWLSAAGLAAVLLVAFSALIIFAHRVPGTVTTASVEHSVGKVLDSASRPACSGSRSSYRCTVEEPASGSGGTATYL